MKTPTSCQRICNAQGFSKTRCLFVFLLLIIVSAAGLHKLYKNKLERASQLQMDRVAQVQLAQREDIQLSLTQVQIHLDDEELAEATRKLRRASILDSNSEFSADVQKLKFLILEQQQAIVHRAELEKLETSILSALEAEEVGGATELLEKYLKADGATTKYQTLKQKRDEIILRSAQIEVAIGGFSTALGNWDEIKTAQCLSDLRELGVNPQLLADMGDKLNRLRKMDSLVKAKVQAIKSKDSGQYSGELLQEVESAIDRLGKHPLLIELHESLLSYPQLVRVPADVSTLDEAYASLKNGGIIELGEGVFYVELNFNKPVVIRGAGVGVTILESRTLNGAGLQFSHPKGGSKVSHLSLRGFIDDDGKYPLLLLNGGTLDLSGVEISGSANHGMAVVAGAARVTNCKFTANHWDGLAVFGPSSSAHVVESSFLENADHGIDVWAGAKVLLQSSKVLRNSKSGLVVSGAHSQAQLIDFQSSSNRECGIYLSQGSSLTAERNQVTKNRFSGLIAQRINQLQWRDSEASFNGEFGYIIDRASMETLQGELAGKENVLGLKSQKRLK